MVTKVLGTAVIAAVFAAPVFAQDEQGSEQDAVERVVETEVKAEYLSQLVNAMRIEIDDMAEHLRLKDQAVRRLHLAAKGAATKTVQKHERSVVQHATRQIQRPFFKINGREVKPEPPEVRDPGQQARENPPLLPPKQIVIVVKRNQVSITVRQDGSSSGTGTSGGTEALKNTEIWKNAVSAVLTKNQIADYQTYRLEQRRRTCVAMVSSFLILELSLRPDQHQPVRQWLEEAIPEIRDSDLVSGTEWVVRNIVRRLDVSGLNKLLSPAQANALQVRLAEWNW